MPGVPWRLVADRRPPRLPPTHRTVHALGQSVCRRAGRTGRRRHRRHVCGRCSFLEELRYAGRQGVWARAELHAVRRIHRLLPSDVRHTRQGATDTFLTPAQVGRASHTRQAGSHHLRSAAFRCRSRLCCHVRRSADQNQSYLAYLRQCQPFGQTSAVYQPQITGDIARYMC